MITGHLYETEIYDSIGDFVHGMPQTIREVGVPEYNISFNCHNNKISVFTYDKERHMNGKDIKKVEMTKDFIDNLIKIKELNNELDILKSNNMNNILNLTKI